LTERQPPGIFLGAYIINYGLFCGIKRLYPLEDLKNSLFCAVNFCCEDSSPVARTSCLKANNPHECWVFGFFFLDVKLPSERIKSPVSSLQAKRTRVPQPFVCEDGFFVPRSFFLPP
jgi:hypothetical protein